MSDDLQLLYLLLNPVFNVEHEWPVPVFLSGKKLLLFFYCLCHRLYPTNIYPVIYLLLVIALDDVTRLPETEYRVCLC
jgi:hypothetical protein